jgi:S1-C subfamily serine protease
MIRNKKGTFKYAFIGAIVSIVLVQSVSSANALAEAPPNNYLSINGGKNQMQMQNVGQNHLHIIPTTFNQQQQFVSPQIDQNETQNTAKTLTDIFRQTQNSTVQIKSAKPNPNEFITVNGNPITRNNVALGSGFVYDGAGHIVTNNHVVEGANKVEVTFVDGNTYPARIIGGDTYTDLAVLQITDNNFSAKRVVPLTIGNSSNLQAGERVVAIGNPFGLYGSITEGIVSGLGRLLPVSQTEPTNPEQGIFGPVKNSPAFSIPNIIQTDAAINPGNSGGPLLNMRGEVIGINTAIFSNTGSYSGVGFAIPSDTMKKVVPSLIQRGIYEHPYLGVSGIDVTSDIAKVMKVNETKGFLVTDITSGGPADKAGIRGGDILTDINGTEVELGGDVIIGIDNTTVRKIDDILSYLETKKQVGDTAKLTIVRDGKPQEVNVTLSDRSLSQENQQQQQRSQSQSTQQQKPSLGISGTNVTPEIAEAMNLTNQTTGFLVVDIIAEGPADKGGLRGGFAITNINGTEVELGGDVIIGIDNTTVRKIDDILSYLDTKKVGDIVHLQVFRDNKVEDVSVTLGPAQSLQQGPSPINPPLSPDSNMPQPSPMPPGSSNNLLDEFYKGCTNIAGKDLCDQLFGGGR